MYVGLSGQYAYFGAQRSQFDYQIANEVDDEII